MSVNVAFSCIIPTHNRDDYLAEALASVASQSEPPAEILVVDDVGSQRTLAAVNEFHTEIPVRYVDASQLARKSAGASRNLGASVACNPYLAFLDDDDLWKPSFLESCRYSLEREESDLVVTWASFLLNGREIDGHSIGAGLIAESAFARNPGLTGSNFVISRLAFLSLEGFDTSLWVSNDRDFLIRFLDAGLFYSVVAQRLVLQRVHKEGQLTNRTHKRAQGIELFKAKYDARLSREDERLLNREIFSILRVSRESRIARTAYTLRQLASYRPRELYRTVVKQLSGKSTRY